MQNGFIFLLFFTPTEDTGGTIYSACESFMVLEKVVPVKKSKTKMDDDVDMSEIEPGLFLGR